MSFIEGVGDEVVAFTVILLVFIFAATITFLLNSSPISENNRNQVYRNQVLAEINHLNSQYQSPEPLNNEENNQGSSQVSSSNSNHTPPSNACDDEDNHSVTEETETLGTCTENVSSGNSQIYPDLNENVTPSAPDTELEEENETNDERQSSDPEGIKVRLKYLDDTERTVNSHPSVTIGDFKRTHFAEDIANNKIVRLIFSGQLLQDSATLQSYAVTDNCVIHVQILQAQTQQNTTSTSQNTDLDLSHLLWPLLSVILGICWILYFKYPEFFNMLSLGMLFMFTGSFVYFYSQIQHQ